MNRRLLLTASIIALIGLGSAMTTWCQRKRAQPLPLDECVNVGKFNSLDLTLHSEFSNTSKVCCGGDAGT